jgi:hypothetical protein
MQLDLVLVDDLFAEFQRVVALGIVQRHQDPFTT